MPLFTRFFSNPLAVAVTTCAVYLFKISLFRIRPYFALANNFLVFLLLTALLDKRFPYESDENLFTQYYMEI